MNHLRLAIIALLTMATLLAQTTSAWAGNADSGVSSPTPTVLRSNSTFDPISDLTLSSYVAGANADATFFLTLPEGNEPLDFATTKAPPGWEFNDGNNIALGEVVATVFTSFRYYGNDVALTFTVTNIEPAGAKARWQLNYPPPYCCLTTELTGTTETGHQFTIDPTMVGTGPPTYFEMTILGRTSSGTPVISNPDVPGSYTWQGDVVSQFGSSVLLETTVIIEALDSDEDGVPDAEDACPLVPGSIVNGCPPIGGAVDIAADSSAPRSNDPGASGRDYAVPTAVAAVVLALVAGGWRTRRRWLS